MHIKPILRTHRYRRNLPCPSLRMRARPGCAAGGPRRLFGLREPADGAPCSGAGLSARGAKGLPSATAHSIYSGTATKHRYKERPKGASRRTHGADPAKLGHYPAERMRSPSLCHRTTARASPSRLILRTGLAAETVGRYRIWLQRTSTGRKLPNYRESGECRISIRSAGPSPKRNREVSLWSCFSDVYR